MTSFRKDDFPYTPLILNYFCVYWKGYFSVDISKVILEMDQ